MDNEISNKTSTSGRRVVGIILIGLALVIAIGSMYGALSEPTGAIAISFMDSGYSLTTAKYLSKLVKSSIVTVPLIVVGFIFIIKGRKHL